MKIQPYDIPGLRGYFSNKYKEDPEFHNHLPDGKFNYKFPRIQYRIINGHPALIGFDEGLNALRKVFFKSDEVIIHDRIYKSFEKVISCSEYEIGLLDKHIDYEFISPWMALNEENYSKYSQFYTIRDKQGFLRTVLKGNLITISKGFNYTIPDTELIKIEGYFIEQPVMFKGNSMLCFKGMFSVNFGIPELIGLGKQSARGFGVVKRK